MDIPDIKVKRYLGRTTYVYNGYHYLSMRSARLRCARDKGTHTKQEWLVKVYFSDYKCSICKIVFDFDELHKDHIIPISKGGSDSIDNLQPCCATCNSIKVSKLNYGKT